MAAASTVDGGCARVVRAPTVGGHRAPHTFLMRSIGDWVSISVLSWLSIGLSGCQAHVRGDLVVDGAQFVSTQCRSGQAFGFSGIELTDTGGRRLRLSGNLEGTCAAALFAPGSPTGTNLLGCGVLTMKAQSSRVDGITNLQGSATLSCQAEAHAIHGQVEFENCH
jgi:hypothetical protein